MKYMSDKELEEAIRKVRANKVKKSKCLQCGEVYVFANESGFFDAPGDMKSCVEHFKP